ncbi:class I SAM-dependent methyltransferase [Streptomyces sp. DSM 110735]|nr:class I SAM-dependent methyltransferase [Streptomyces sp. DSM 110735]
MIERSSPWYAYATHAPKPPPGPGAVPTRFEWGTSPGTGPGAAAFGRSMRGHRVLELGCGQGHNAAHLAGVQAARVVAIDPVDLQIRRARERYGHLADATFLTCDALRYLGRRTVRFDAVYSVFGAVGLVAPDLLLPAIARVLRPHGLLVFSVPHPRRSGRPFESGGGPRWDALHLSDGTWHPVVRWELAVGQWQQALLRSGLRPLGARELGDPRRAGVTTLMVRARKSAAPWTPTGSGQGRCKEAARKVPYPPGKTRSTAVHTDERRGIA